MSHAKAFNNHFGIVAKETAKNNATIAGQRAQNAIKEGYAALVGATSVCRTHLANSVGIGESES